MDLLEKDKINYSLIEAGSVTTTKVRVIGEHQQILRLDFEETDIDMPQKFKNQIKERALSLFPKINIIIISDYLKGVCGFEICRSVIDSATKEGKIVIVDPKGSDWEKYRGATIATPNVKELGEIAGKPVLNIDEDIERLGMEVLEKYGLEYLLVTRSEKGMSFISHKDIHHIPTEAQEVYDVSGAGDTVVATLAAAVSSGMEWIEAVKIANRAAGIVVSRFGTVPVKYDELLDSYEAKEKSKILSLDRLMKKIERFRKENKNIVFTNGCFDIIHSGHVMLLRKAKEMGDILIVGLNSDNSVRRLKGEKRPVNKENDRAEILSSLEFVDFVVIFNEDTPYELLQKIRPDVLLKGGDYKAEDVVGREFSAETVIVPFLKGYSTSEIIKQCNVKSKRSFY